MIESATSRLKETANSQDIYLQLLNRVNQQQQTSLNSESKGGSAVSTPERIVNGVVANSYQQEQERLKAAEEEASSQIRSGRLDVKV